MAIELEIKLGQQEPINEEIVLKNTNVDQESAPSLARKDGCAEQNSTQSSENCEQKPGGNKRKV